MSTKRTRVAIPAQLAAEIDALVGKRERTSFITRTASKELMRLRQIRALERAAGAWKDEDHPEFKHGAREWVKALRRSWPQRVNPR